MLLYLYVKFEEYSSLFGSFKVRAANLTFARQGPSKTRPRVEVLFQLACSASRLPLPGSQAQVRDRRLFSSLFIYTFRAAIVAQAFRGSLFG